MLNEILKSSLEGDTVDNITKQYGLHHVIREPTHILGNTLSCIHLTFTSQPNFLTAIIRLYMLNSTYRFISLHLIYEKFGTAKTPILSATGLELINEHSGYIG